MEQVLEVKVTCLQHVSFCVSVCKKNLKQAMNLFKKQNNGALKNSRSYNLYTRKKYSIYFMLPLHQIHYFTIFRSSHPKVFLRKGVLKICSKFTGEHPCRSVMSITLLCNFIEIALWHVCSPVNLLHISKTPLPKNTAGWLLLCIKLCLWKRIINFGFRNH